MIHDHLLKIHTSIKGKLPTKLLASLLEQLNELW